MKPKLHVRSPSFYESGVSCSTECLLSNPGRSPANLSNPLVQDALEHLALIDLIDLPNEAKIELCRATRDLSTCRRHVQHVLIACGHASLCAKCSKRFDVCPVCRSSIPDDGNRLRLRLYYKCMEAGLIPKQSDDRFQEKELSGEHVIIDIQRLYSLFNVALENSLVSLICHYVTDVCMDENAVSSDPMSAFLLDEVAVKDWCQQAFKSIICNLKDIYHLGNEAIKFNLHLLQKFVSHLSGISIILEAIASSFKEIVAVQLHDLHHLFENILKAKQHLEVMIWCSQHQFLQNVQSRFFNLNEWNLNVQERKQAAVSRSWQDFSINLGDPNGRDDNTLFIEEALSNLGLEDSFKEKNDVELDISCLQEESSPLFFLSKIDKGKKEGCYPFHNLRIAIDILFLHGTSDMVIAKQAILLYYLFDRHWTRPDSEWKYLVDDFAASFGFTRHSMLESLVFFLLDDHTAKALEEASHILPEIATFDRHPKIAQVLLERQRPEVALNFLRCTGRDELCAFSNPETDCSRFISLGEAVTAIRVRIECGLLSEAFMYQRMYYSKIGEKLKHGFNPKTCTLEKSCSGINVIEVLVTEICYLCIRRNLVDRMIELPWNSDEEKYLEKCLLDHARQYPSSLYGSLLIVFHLQRYRYMEAYRAGLVLQKLEQKVLENVDEAVALQIKLISQWREGLIEKGLELLPEVQRLKLKNRELDDNDVKLPYTSDLSNESSNSPALINSSCINSSGILPTENNCLPSRKTNASGIGSLHDTNPEFGSKVPSILQQRLLAPVGSSVSSVNTVTIGAKPSNLPNGKKSPSSGKASKSFGYLDSKQAYRSLVEPLPMKFNLGSRSKPVKQLDGTAKRRTGKGQFQPEGSLKTGLFAEIDVIDDELMLDSYTNGSNEPTRSHNHANSFVGNMLDGHWSTKDANLYSFSYSKKDYPVEEQSLKSGPRWRSGDSSGEDEDLEPRKNTSNWNSSASQRLSRLSSR